jgi:hypothetical protein
LRSETLAKLNKSAFDNFENIVSAVGLNIGAVNLHSLLRPACSGRKGLPCSALPIGMAAR